MIGSGSFIAQKAMQIVMNECQATEPQRMRQAGSTT